MRSPALTSNGLKIPRSHFAPLHATDLDQTDDTDLRARYAANGYLWLRRALPAEQVLDLRQAYFDQFDAAMFRNRDRRRGEFSGRLPAALPRHGVPGHPAHAFVRTALFRSFLDLPVFRRIAERVLDAPVARLRRTPLRHFIRGSDMASRAHLDRTYLDPAYDDRGCVTLWLPLGDCPIEAGALVYLEGSHTDPDIEAVARANAPSDRPEDRRPLTHDLEWLAETTGRRWLTADFAAGDVVVHSPSIVHASIDPMIDLMRLSTDIRFRRVDIPSDPRWEVDWAADDGY